MTKNRIPRKLKKGMRTLFHAHPRTKWQRRAAVLLDKMLIHFISDAIITSAWRKFAEGLEPGGIALPSDQPRSNEIIVSRDQLQAFADKINDGCNGAITATIEGDQLTEGLHRARCKAIIK